MMNSKNSDSMAGSGALTFDSDKKCYVVMLCRHAQCKCLKGNMLSKWIKSAGDRNVQNEVTCANINFCKVAELTPQIFGKQTPPSIPTRQCGPAVQKRIFYDISPNVLKIVSLKLHSGQR